MYKSMQEYKQNITSEKWKINNLLHELTKYK